MKNKPNLKSVAKLAEVSVPTASQVMRGTGRISENTRKKVLLVENNPRMFCCVETRKCDGEYKFKNLPVKIIYSNIDLN